MNPLVVGIGHPHRGDDGVGLLAAQAIAALNLPGLDVIEHHGEGGDLINLWTGRPRLAVIDCVVSGAAVGTLHRWELGLGDPPAHLFPKTSHVFGLGEAVAMARLLGVLPASAMVFGIEGADFEMGGAASAAAAKSIPEIVSIVVDFMTGGL